MRITHGLNRIRMVDTTIGVSDGVKARLGPVKDEWGAAAWDKFMNDLIEKNVDIDAKGAPAPGHKTSRSHAVKARWLEWQARI